MLLDNVEPEKWYSVKEVSGIVGWSVDAVRRWIYSGKLKAFIHPERGSKRKRIYRSMRVLGKELIRFINGHLSA